MRFFSIILLSAFSLISCRSSGQSIQVIHKPTNEESIPANVIIGTISYIENVKTPTPFWAEVELCELKADGRAGKTIAKMMVESPRQMPVDYRLIVDPNKIDKTKKYGLIARVFVGFDSLMWENKIPKPALTRQTGSRIDIIVNRVKETN